MGPQDADVAHPAFAKLFVETEYLADFGAILATRRKRTPTEPEIWAAHLSVANGEAVGKPEFETDRARFLGRGQGISAPIAMLGRRPLTNSVGAVLDPIFALRRRVRSRLGPRFASRSGPWPQGRAQRCWIASTNIATPRHMSARRRWPGPRRRCSCITSASSPARPDFFNASPATSSSPARDCAPRRIPFGRAPVRNPVCGLRAFPAICRSCCCESPRSKALDVARQILQAHEYWLMKQLAVDLVILNERKSSYVQDLQIAIETLVRASQSRPAPGIERRPGRVFVLRADLIDAATRSLAGLDRARCACGATRQPFGSTRSHRRHEPRRYDPFKKSPRRSPRATCRAPTPELEFFNGLGGFGAGGKEYVTILGPGQSTPAPWINVIANSTFGFQISTEGSGYTWSANSRENQLTPWSNDPVSDPPGEAFYLRDDRTGDVWSPTALPIRDASGDLCRPSRPGL